MQPISDNFSFLRIRASCPAFSASHLFLLPRLRLHPPSPSPSPSPCLRLRLRLRHLLVYYTILKPSHLHPLEPSLLQWRPKAGAATPPNLHLRPNQRRRRLRRPPRVRGLRRSLPGLPLLPSRAVQALGGLSEIAKVRSSESGNLELRFRPEDPYCHPAFGELRPSASLLLRISKTKNDLSAEVMARVKHAYHLKVGPFWYAHHLFDEMIKPPHFFLFVATPFSMVKKRPWDSIDATNSGKNGSVEMDGADIMMLVPPLFTSKDRPEKIVLNPSANLFSKNIQRGVVMHRWEMDIDECLAIPFDRQNILSLNLYPCYIHGNFFTVQLSNLLPYIFRLYRKLLLPFCVHL
uniref:Transcription factor IIIC subunit Tfc1/Sfc1 triple barrel domain-containing protein n=1 Tax=Ananas comosus var. bracteatus TaxID=296719 RepID=A0A6V7P9U2_ANACO|nr:unnamed protein product [Ananas comosus var. bracteatus]